MPKTKILNSAGITAAIGLAALPAIFSLAPMFSVAEANAEPSTIGAAATIVPNLSLSAQNVSMVMTPTGSGTVFKTASVDATVSTNNETGYTLYFSDKDDNTSLKHANLADKAITSTETSVTGESMLPNTWGYTLSTPAPEEEAEINNTTNLGLTYNSIPTDYTTINSSDTLTEGETSKLTFGVKINNGIPSGTYSDEILISAVINYSSAGYDQNQLWLGADGNQIETMQEMTPAVCASVPTPTASATETNIPTIPLTDTRDSKTYTVKKLADGNCWMTSDLAIEDYTLTPADSNVAIEVTLPAAKGHASFVDFNDGKLRYTTSQIANDGVDSTYLYNWYAAIAATPGTDLETDEDYDAGKTAPQDICPKGWHLPDNDGNGSWNKLLRVGQGGYEIATSDSNYSSAITSWGTVAKFTVADQNPLNMHLTGRLQGRTLDSTNSGSYWTRTANYGAYAYYLGFASNYVSPQNYDLRQFGRAVRCVADDKKYMQDWAGCSELPEHKTAILYDKRDDRDYTVSKLKDGNCWMTSDLALGSTTEDITLTPEKSNVTTNFTLRAAKTATNQTANSYDTDYTFTGNDTNNNTYLYNWYAATAGSGTQSLTADQVAPQDICPKGWHLPDNSGDTSWDRLLNRSNGVYKNIIPTDLTSGNNLLGLHTTGLFYSGSLGSTGSGGLYWSRIASASTDAYRLGFNNGSVAPQGNDNKQYGFAVRCVLGS